MKKSQIILWIAALVVGVVLGLLRVDAIDRAADIVATVYTRLFRLLAVPVIVLAIVSTLASLGKGGGMGRMFRITLTYTLLTTTAAAAVALGLYVLVAPGNLPASAIGSGEAVPSDLTKFSYSDHLMSMVPDNIVRPFLDGNVLGLLLLCFAVGIALSRMPDTPQKRALMHGIAGLQELLYVLIRWLIAVLPLGITAFAAQLAAEVGGGVMLDSLGKYVLVILAGNCLQFFVILPLFLLAKGLNPLKVLSGMMPAVLMALFTKSSAATLPVTMDSAERRVGADPKVARFVLPVCTTVNMNGCAAFILVTSLFVMQNNGMDVSAGSMLVWLLISVVSAFGNAGVPMGCYFLTLSLMAGMGADVGIMGVILPIYTIIDMVETAENVWSDSCVCAITDKTLKASASTHGRVG